MTKGFERFRAEKERQGRTNDPSGGGMEDEAEPQESGSEKTSVKEPGQDASPEKTPPVFSDDIEIVLRVFNGTVVG